MKDLLLYLVSSLVDHPADVRIDEKAEQGIVVLSLSVNPADMGKVIGKGGKIIKALRNIIKILAVKEDKKFELVLEEVAS